jgi:hypothetical protein
MSKTIDERLAEGRQYRDIDIGAFEHRAEDDGKKIVRGYASTFNSPYLLYRDGNYEVWEQIDARAFDHADMSDVIMQYDHVGRVFARRSNGTLSVGTDDVGLAIEADLSGTELGRQLYEEIDGGYTTKMSFGFTVAEDKRDVDEDHETGKVRVMRTVSSISRLWDVSVVSLPANNATYISARSYCEGVIAEAAEEIRKRREADALRKRIKIKLEAMK